MSKGRPPATNTTPSDALDIADLVDEGVIAFGLDMKVTAWNREAERIYGWKRGEVVGGVIQAAVRCSPSEPLKVILEKVHETGSWRGEFTRTAKGGDSVVVRAKWVLRRDAGGAPVGIVETSTDITNVRRTEEELRRIQYQYQNLFQASVASFWELEFAEVGDMVRNLIRTGVSDLREYFRDHPNFVRAMVRATRILSFNEQSLAMFGRGNADELKSNLDPLWPEESLAVFAESVVAAFEKKPHFSAEAAFLSLDGRRYDTIFNVSYPPVLLQSSRLLIGIIDITQAKKARAAQERSERRYQDFFHFLPVALLNINGPEVIEVFREARAAGITDLGPYLEANPAAFSRALEGLKVVEANRRAFEILRAEKPGDLLGPVTRYWSESPEVIRGSLAARYAGKRGFEASAKMPAHDGTVLDVLFFAAFAPITGDEATSLVGLIDVSDRVKAQDMLTKAQAEMAHAARVSVLGELTASIAHEVSQPLTAIESYSEASLLWLARSPPDIEEVRRLSERTVAESQRAAEIIDRIRSMALRSATERKHINPNDVVNEALLFLRHELQRHDVRASLELDPTVPLTVGDRVQLQQVVVNLAFNAIQAMTSANVSKRRIILHTQSIGDNVVIAVEDTGPGVPLAVRGRIFESFFTTKATGMGIGLAICRSIVEAHGGVIAVQNRREGEGARFEISLPLGPSEIAASA
jgi:PAS domain S-box-containing protein